MTCQDVKDALQKIADDWNKDAGAPHDWNQSMKHTEIQQQLKEKCGEELGVLYDMGTSRYIVKNTA